MRKNGPAGPETGPKGAEPAKEPAAGPEASSTDLEDDTGDALPILEALAADPSLSQRELAGRAGLSVTRAHFVLKRLTEKGLVKVKSAARSRHKLGYLYLLTPRGLEAKARLTYGFMQRMARQYGEMVARVDAALDAALDRLADDDVPGRAPPVPALVPVSILGRGPLAEVVRDRVAGNRHLRLVSHHEHAILGIVADPEIDRPAPGPRRWVDLG